MSQAIPIGGWVNFPGKGGGGSLKTPGGGEWKNDSLGAGGRFKVSRGWHLCNDNLIWHLSCQQDDHIWRMEMNMPKNCGFLHKWRMKINFSRQKWKYSKSVFHWLVNLSIMRFLCFILRPWDCPQNLETWEVCSWMGGGLSNTLTNLCVALYCYENSVQKYKNKKQKIQWQIKQSHA